MENNLYILTRDADYDEYQTMVVVAVSVRSARAMANQHDYEKGHWTAENAVCQDLGRTDAVSGVIHADFNAG